MSDGTLGGNSKENPEGAPKGTSGDTSDEVITRRRDLRKNSWLNLKRKFYRSRRTRRNSCGSSTERIKSLEDIETTFAPRVTRADLEEDGQSLKRLVTATATASGVGTQGHLLSRGSQGVERS